MCLQLPDVSKPSARLAAAPSMTHTSDRFPPPTGNSVCSTNVGAKRPGSVLSVWELALSGLEFKDVMIVIAVGFHPPAPHVLHIQKVT